MSASSNPANVVKDKDAFKFPYQPYPIQLQFMNAVYQVIQDKRIGLFESPTGTGKSLSLLCSTMRWLRDHQDEPLILEEEMKNLGIQETLPPPSKTSGKSSPTTTPSPKVPSWVLEFQAKKQLEEAEWKKREHKRIQESYQSKLKQIRLDSESDYRPHKRAKMIDGDESATHRSVYPGNVLDRADSDAQEDYLVTDYESDQDKDILDPYDVEEQSTGLFKTSRKARGLGSNMRRRRQEELTKEEEELAEFPVRKVFFCSRTHSQLSQFIQEISKTEWIEDLRLVVLGSRKTMCINPKVKALPTLTQMNDKCLDMMGKQPPTLKTKSSTNTVVFKIGNSSSNDGYSSSLLLDGGGQAAGENNNTVDESAVSACSFYHAQNQKTLRDNILAKPKDIEELVVMGELGRECPYFASRAAVSNAELVVLPYPTLLHKSTREALGIDLRGSIVILDEAHNIIDSVNAIHTVELTLGKTYQALSQLTKYRTKYLMRLKPKNLAYIDKIIAILNSLVKYLETESQTEPVSDSNPKVSLLQANAKPTTQCQPNTPSHAITTKERQLQSMIVRLNDFLFDTRLDTQNLFKIDKYLQTSDLIHKVQGFCTSTEVEVAIKKEQRTIKVTLEDSEFEKHRPALGQVSQFLMSLTTQSDDGCLLKTVHPNDPKQSSVKYLLLNPEIHFQDILLQARSVILAGGTMQPFGDFAQHLLSNDISSPKLDPTRIQPFTCSHIIPDNNISTIVVPQGPTGIDFNFTFENRNDSHAYEEAGRLVANLCNLISDGIVIFSPSYQFEDKLMQIWKSSGILDTIQKKKRVFREPKTTTVDAVLQEYSEAIESNTGPVNSTHNGAIMSCVVGGKLSEGINFKDGLGRAVIMLGLPFPNARDPVLMEKLAHIEHKAQKNNAPGSSMNSSSSGEYYENLCMKAVNQSIGRSIRHIGDYAVIVLADKRYAKPSIQNKLPQWIKKSVSVSKGFGEVARTLAEFFKQKKSLQIQFEAARLSKA